MFQLTSEYCQDFPLDKLPPDSQLIGPPPSKTFLRTVAQYGILQPIGIVASSERTRVIYGRRRIKAARATGMTTIQALIYPPGTAPLEILSIIENEQRSESYLNDLLQIESLRENGLLDQEIRAKTGLAKAVFDARLRFQNLTPRARQLWEEGKINVAIATFLARYPARVQQIAATRVVKGGLTQADIVEIAKEQEMKGVPLSVLDEPLAPNGVSIAGYRACINELLTILREYDRHSYDRGYSVAQPYLDPQT